MILGKLEIQCRRAELFPKTDPYKISAASADVRIGHVILREDGSRYSLGREYWLEPGEFVLVDMLEHVTLPRNVAAMFTLKSTRAREGYQHAVAGWVDPGWNGILTMELKNNNQRKALPLYAGMPIGQLIFMDTLGGGEYTGRYQGSVETSGPREELP